MIHLSQFINQDSRAGSGGGAPTELGPIGTGTSSTVYQPAYYLYEYGWLGLIIPSSDIGASYTISKLAFYYELDDDPFPFVGSVTGQTIKLAHTTSTNFSSNSDNNLSDISPFNMTTVKSNFSFVFSGGDGWKEFSFDTNFNYNSSYNLVIKWENNWGDYEFGYPSTRFTNRTGNVQAQGYQDGSYPTGSATYERESNDQMNVKLWVQ